MGWDDVRNVRTQRRRLNKAPRRLKKPGPVNLKFKQSGSGSTPTPRSEMASYVTIRRRYVPAEG
jgi:hypothetical protein